MYESYSILNYPSLNKRYGEFKTKTPFSAAKKGFELLQDKYDLSNSDNEKKYLQFLIINNKTNEIKKYLGVRIILNEPIKKYNKLQNYRLAVFVFPKKLDVKEIICGNKLNIKKKNFKEI
jgi:hypothetical protein